MNNEEKILKTFENFKSMKILSNKKLGDLLYNLSEVDDYYKKLKKLLVSGFYNSLTKKNMDLLLETLVFFEINSKELVRNLNEATSIIKQMAKKVDKMVDT